MKIEKEILMKVSSTPHAYTLAAHQKQGNFQKMDAETLRHFTSNKKLMQDLYDSGSKAYMEIRTAEFKHQKAVEKKEVFIKANPLQKTVTIVGDACKGLGQWFKEQMPERKPKESVDYGPVDIGDL
jgi:hypothetical protein